MGLMSKLKFWKKGDEILPPITPEAPLAPLPPRPVTAESAGIDNVKAKVDLILTQIESIKVQNETLNERVKNTEKAVAEILAIAKA
jgi:hypothetical protein